MIDGAGMQQMALGGSNEAAFSSAVMFFGVCRSQIWSWASTATPMPPPIVHWFGSGSFGHVGSHSKLGTPSVSASAAAGGCGAAACRPEAGRQDECDDRRSSRSGRASLCHEALVSRSVPFVVQIDVASGEERIGRNGVSGVFRARL